MRRMTCICTVSLSVDPVHTMEMSSLQLTGLDVTGGLRRSMCRPMCGEGQYCKQSTAKHQSNQRLISG